MGVVSLRVDWVTGGIGMIDQKFAAIGMA